MHITSMEEHLEESDSEVKDSNGDTDRFMSLSNRAGGGANDASLLEDEDYDIYEGYENDAYDLSDEQLTFYNSFDIRSEKQYAPISFATLVRNDSSKHVSNFCTLDTRTKIKDTTEMLIPLSLILEANVRVRVLICILLKWNMSGKQRSALFGPDDNICPKSVVFKSEVTLCGDLRRRSGSSHTKNGASQNDWIPNVVLRSQRSMEVKEKNGATTSIKDTTNMASSSNTKGLVNDINLVTLTNSKVGNTVNVAENVVEDSDSDVDVVYDETAQFIASGGLNNASLYEDKDYDFYDTYDLEGLMKQQLASCNRIDINLL
ncbi:hypothetical protein Tco_0251846 [Tanacetum coccineum]